MAADQVQTQKYTPLRDRWIRIAMLAVVAFAIGAYYLWAVRASGNRFYWKNDLPGYYNYLGRAFAQGQLHLPIEPSRELLSLPNPWDPSANAPHKMHDMVLYKGHYYLYHGAGPALMLFAPWRILTGYDLPENFAVFLLCFGGFIFSSGALLRILSLANARPGPLLLGLMLVALGTCQSVPYLLNRILVYEIAIAGGYFCVSAAVFFFARAIQSSNAAFWLAASGLMFGVAIACRPHLGLAGGIALAGLIACLARSPREMPVRFQTGLAAFITPLVAVGTAVGAYNHVRFGNPLEFGVRYLLAGEASQQQVKLAAANVAPGLYYMLFCPPDFNAVFPWIRLAFRFPFDSPNSPFPPGYFIEPTAGVLFLAPFIVAALFAPVVCRAGNSGVRTLLWMILASSVAVLLFITGTGFTTQRYHVDYAPWACLAALGIVGIVLSRSVGRLRILLITALVPMVSYSVVANLALGISGPYDDILTNRPAGYLRIAGWFSPSEQFRPVLSSQLDVDMNVHFRSHGPGFREPLVTTGHQAFRYLLCVEHLEKEKLRLVSQFEMSVVAHDFQPPEDRRVRVRLTYSAASHKLVTSVDGVPVLSQDVKALVTAPAQVTVGENRIDVHSCDRRFTGEIEVVENTIRGPATLLSARE